MAGFIVAAFVLGFFMSLGKAAVFKHIATYYPDNVGAVGGLVGMIGGLGGFVLPIAFGALNDLTGLWSSCFMLLFVIVVGLLVWMDVAVRRTQRGDRVPRAEHVASSPVRQPNSGSGIAMTEKLVIIGNGMAPGRMLEHLFDKAPGRYEVTIFNAEPRVNYDRIMLSPVLSGEKDYEQIIIHGDGWYIKNGITLYKGHKVTADRPRREDRHLRSRCRRRRTTSSSSPRARCR